MRSSRNRRRYSKDPTPDRIECPDVQDQDQDQDQDQENCEKSSGGNMKKDFEPLRRIFIAAALMAASLAPAHSQQFPDKPIRILVGFQAGSSSDVGARVIAQKLSDTL